MEQSLSQLAPLLFVLAVVWLYLVLPIQMAWRRGRSAVFWILFGILLTPILSIMALIVLGKYVPPDK